MSNSHPASVYHTVSHLTFPISAVARSVFNEKRKEEVEISNDVNVKVCVRVPESAILTFFDYLVYAAICTVVLGAKSSPVYFDVVQVAELLTGGFYSNTLKSSKIIKDIEESIEKMRQTKIIIFYGQQERAWPGWNPEPIFRNEEKKVFAYLLRAEKTEVEISHGIKHSGYGLTEEPVLLSYSKSSNNEIATVDTKGFAGPKTKANLILNGYLRLRVHSIVSGYESNNRVILLRQIYGLFEKKLSSTEKKRIREMSIKIFDFMVSNEEISNYEFRKKSKGNDYIFDAIIINKKSMK